MSLLRLITARQQAISYDASVIAAAFNTAAGITDSTQQSAILQLVTDLIGYGLWTKMKAIYPFVGGTASSHSYNLKNTAQFQITWFGGMTHNSNGITGNGTNAYGLTNIFPSTDLTPTNTSMGVYVRNNITGNSSDMVSYTSGFNGYALQIKWSDGNAYWVIADNSFGSAGNFYAVATGLFSMSRIDNTKRTLYKNNSSVSVVSVGTTSFGALPNLPIAARSDSGVIQFFSLRNYAFGFVGLGLTDTEVSNLYTAVQAFQTTLGRQV